MIVRDALRLVLRHWPVLLSLVFAGLAGHQVVLRLAAWLARGQAGPVLLLFPLAAGVLFAALVLMVRSVRVSLPDPQAQRSWPSWRAALIPFAIIYFAFGRFRGDLAYVLKGIGADSSLPMVNNTVVWLGALAGGSAVLWLGVGFWRPRGRWPWRVWSVLRGYFGLSVLVLGLGAVVVWAGEPAGRKLAEPLPVLVPQLIWLTVAPAAWFLFAALLYRRGLPRVRPVAAAFFVLAFVVADVGARWLWELERLALGPQDTQRIWLPLAQVLPVLNTSLATVLVVCFASALAAGSAQRETGVVMGPLGETDRDRFGSGRGDEEDERLVPV